MNLSSWRARVFAAGLTAAAFALAGCDDQIDASGGRSLAPIPQTTLAMMDQIGTTASAPVIFRAYKKEAEFEIWKQKTDGQYALLKTYPMCRWSGQLGPKKREGRPAGARGLLYDRARADEPELALLPVVQRRLSQRL